MANVKSGTKFRIYNIYYEVLSQVADDDSFIVSLHDSYSDFIGLDEISLTNIEASHKAGNLEFLTCFPWEKSEDQAWLENLQNECKKITEDGKNWK